jgi:hypothetical protein
VCLYTALIGSKGVNDLTTTMPSIFAKTSLVWCSLLYIYTNKNVKREIYESTAKFWFRTNESKSKNIINEAETFNLTTKKNDSLTKTQTNNHQQNTKIINI